MFFITGDLHDGAGLSDVTKPGGKDSDLLFEKTDFDLLTIGNHDVGKDLSTSAHKMAQHFQDKYLTSNVFLKQTSGGNTTQTPIGKLYRYFTTPNGLKIMAFGVIFDMSVRSDANYQVQPAKDMIKEDLFKKAVQDTDVDLFVLIGHNPVELKPDDNDNNSTVAFLATKIQSMRKKPNTPVQVFGGHSHERKFKVYSTSSTGLQSGKYGDTVGWLAMNGIESKTYTGAKQPVGVPHPPTHAKPKIHDSNLYDAFDTKKWQDSLESSVLYARRYLDFNRETFQFHTDTVENAKAFDTKERSDLSSTITSLREKYNLGHYYGCAPRSYSISCRPQGDEGNIYTLVEDALGKIVQSKTRSKIPRLILSNRNSIRYDLAQGPYTLDDAYIVCFRRLHEIC